jgi:uncharacterized membrane protein
LSWEGGAVNLAGVILATLVGVSSPPTTLPTVGMEGSIQINLPGTRLEAKPVVEKSPLVLRIASAKVGKESGFYDLRYIGLVPGQHDLKQYLVRVDGSSTDDLPAIPVRVSGLLPEHDTGQLTPAAIAPWPFLGGYKVTMIIAAVLWLLLLIPLILMGRKHRVQQIAAATQRPLTLADRLRPLLERAAKGGLSADEKATIERLLLRHWQRKLSLSDTDPSDAIVTLRKHPEAGQLLRCLEDWLHRRPESSNSSVNITALLQPYTTEA